ncbi:uncharacterized protein JCM15063_002820, partial [Sporobolomyces koalae]|uniref:uncharacterized protein n=1 Tax=Sporobolomyces koalae TaxID=500713 RepID=UPI003180B88C
MYTSIASTSSHGRTASVSTVSSLSNPIFKRRFKPILFTLLSVTCITWIGLARHTAAFGSKVELAQANLPRSFTNASHGPDPLLHIVDHEDDRNEVFESLARLPVCPKTFLFRFAGLHGQGSELNLMLRLAALSTHFGYTFLIDSTEWNYGPFISYFEPLAPTIPLAYPSNGAPSLKCRPPRANSNAKRTKVKLSPLDHQLLTDQPLEDWVPEWTNADHVVWGPHRDMDGLDRTILNLFTDHIELDHLHELDRAPNPNHAGQIHLGGLDPEQALPDEFHNAFDRLSDEIKKVWKPNSDVLAMVQQSIDELGLARPESELKRLRDLVIGVHVRLGDKYLEADRIGPSAVIDSNDPSTSAGAVSPYSSAYTARPGLDDSMITNYFAAVIKSINSLLSLSSTSTAKTLESSSARQAQLEYLDEISKEWQVIDAGGKPTLVLMSDDDQAVYRFQRHPLADRFRVVGTSSSSVEQAVQVGEQRMKKRIVTVKKKKQQQKHKEQLKQKSKQKANSPTDKRGFPDHRDRSSHWKALAGHHRHESGSKPVKFHQIGTTDERTRPVIPAGF